MIFTSIYIFIVNHTLENYKALQLLFCLINFFLSLTTLILNFLLYKKTNRIRKEIIKYKYLYEDIEEIRIFVYIFLISCALTIIFLLYFIYLIYNEYYLTKLKCVSQNSIPQISSENISNENNQNEDEQSRLYKEHLIKEIYDLTEEENTLASSCEDIKKENIEKKQNKIIEIEKLTSNYSQINNNIEKLQKQNSKVDKEIKELKKKKKLKQQLFKNKYEKNQKFIIKFKKLIDERNILKINNENKRQKERMMEHEYNRLLESQS